MWFSKAKEGAAESEAPSAGARSAARPKVRRRATATSHSDWGEKYIAGVPARIMRPRLVFLSCLIAICMFGLLMIYSASSVESLQENGSSWFFLYRQAIFMFIGFVLFAMIGSRLLPWPLFRSKLVWGVWFGVLVLLIAVLFVGQGAEEWGASRWIDLGIFNLQPAEVAKPVIIVLTAKIFADYFEDGTIDTRAFLIQMLIMLPFPLFLIFKEPDLGTTIAWSHSSPSPRSCSAPPPSSPRRIAPSASSPSWTRGATRTTPATRRHWPSWPLPRAACSAVASATRR